ncbi:MAG TPA: PAS domain-containing sensor histidine kinase [Gemmatimonadaceae bacterium]|nr:PAS domain-containing sensor histidine kinase [Gemmatimonadaceae bacterium]
MSTTDESSLVLLEALLASAPVGIAFLDSDLRIVRINGALASVLGRPVEQCIGRSARELSPPGLWPVAEFALRRVVETGESVHDYEFSGPDAARDDRRHWIASVFPVRLDGEHVGGVGAVLRDVTARVRSAERDRAQARRRDRSYALADALVAATSSREVIAAVVEHGAAAMGAVGCVVALRSADGRYLDLLGAEGMPPDVASEWRSFPLTAPTPLSYVARTGSPLFLESADDWTRQFPELLELAKTVGHQANAVIPLIIDGQSIGALGMAFDRPHAFTDDERAFAITLGRQCALALERARLLESERAARNDADAANQVKTQFLATMSHELRTPLNAIGGYAELLELGIHGPITEAQRDVLSRIQRSQHHLLSLINNVLNLVKLDTHHVRYDLTTVSLGSVLDFVAEATGPQVQAKRLRYDASRCSRDLAIRADPEKLRQILLNLLSNAIKFTDEGGAISVDCSADRRTVWIHVNDTGIGIAEDQRQKIFEPFVQVDRRLNRPMEGTGLGLAISRELAHGMKGELTVESKVGVGSTFTLALPRTGPD